MSHWTASTLRAATGGSWVRRPASAEHEPVVASFSTDTRSIRPGDAFIALRGERFDAHEFLDSAAAAGAAMLVVDRAEAVPAPLLQSPAGPAVLRVADTRRALGALAAAHRRTLEGTRVVAVVGSNGKTTTARLIDAALRARLRGSCSPRSFNNDVGVPLTLLAARKSDQYVVCEVGSNHPGETATLGAIVRPDIAVVTSVGRDHMEFFNDLPTVAREHAAIFVDLAPGGLAVVPFGEALLADYLKPVPHVVTFGTADGADLRAGAIRHARRADGSLGLTFTVNERRAIDLPLLGGHNALNALAAFAVARRLGLDEASIGAGLAAAAPADMRLNHRMIRGVECVIDCYNANPDSLEAALTAFAEVCPEPGRRVLVLGDMLEMGPHAEAAHREAADAVARRCPARRVALVGEAFARAAGCFERAMPGATITATAALNDADAGGIAASLAPGDAVLFKGSRGIRLERIVQALERAAPVPSVAQPLAAPR